MDVISAYAASGKGEHLKPFKYQPGPLGAEQVEVAVEYCGICHSDISMLDSEWGPTKYPIVPGHEVIGTVVALGSQARKVQVGQQVGIGWSSGSCMACRECLRGDHHLCASVESTIVGRHGGFADRVRAHWAWAVPLPEGLDPAKAGPLYCGGITVFSPIVASGVKPTDRVGVIGIGGLGHLALKFLSKWGCEVTAFTSNPAKAEEARRLGANRILSSKDTAAMQGASGKFDFIISTVNVPLDWAAIINTLAPKGRLHFVGAVLEPVPLSVMSLIGEERVLSGSPTGSPSVMSDMLDFCARHQIEPVTQEFPMSKVNEALEHLRSGKARYRVVLRA